MTPSPDPRGRSLAQQIREDWVATGRDWTLPGFRALVAYRIGAWVRQDVRWRPLGWFLSRWHGALYRFVRNRYGIELPATARVGRRVLIAHQSGIVIHPEAVIGDDCIIRQNVTIAARPDRPGAPNLGRSVDVGCGAVILGPVSVGDEARIGANVVVTTDVPAHGRVAVASPRVRLAGTGGIAEGDSEGHVLPVGQRS